jgi:hypothetical protein
MSQQRVSLQVRDLKLAVSDIKVQHGTFPWLGENFYN